VKSPFAFAKRKGPLPKDRCWWENIAVARGDQKEGKGGKGLNHAAAVGRLESRDKLRGRTKAERVICQRKKGAKRKKLNAGDGWKIVTRQRGRKKKKRYSGESGTTVSGDGI